MTIFSALKALFHRRDKRSLSADTEKRKRVTRKESSSHSSHITNSDVTTPTNSTKQTSSSGYTFQYRDGRRYHADADVAYVLPNDDDEADRVHQQHWILRYALQSNYQAPVKEMLENGIVVLDSGCGPATWTFEMGECYPRSTFHGIDASCVFPENIKPANVEFVIGNIAKHVPYPDNTFDYIHQRLLFLGLTDSDWTNSLQEMYRILKPGGYIELAEPDIQDLHNMGPLLKKLHHTMSEMMSSRDMSPKIACELEDRLIKTGFVNTVPKVFQLSLNHTDKAGTLLWENYRHGYMNVRPVMVGLEPSWADPKVYAKYVEACGEEVAQLKTSIHWYTYYAQKPLN